MFTKISIAKCLVPAALAACISVVALPASASTTGSMSGAACESEQPPVAPTYASHLIRLWSGLFNYDTTARSVVCPIRRVNTSNTNGFSDFQVFMQDVSPSHTLMCSLSAEDSFGNVLDHKEAYYDPANPNRLKFTSMLTTSSSLGTYSLWCSVPAMNGNSPSSISSMYWVEP